MGATGDHTLNTRRGEKSKTGPSIIPRACSWKKRNPSGAWQNTRREAKNHPLDSGHSSATPRPLASAKLFWKSPSA